MLQYLKKNLPILQRMQTSAPPFAASLQIKWLVLIEQFPTEERFGVAFAIHSTLTRKRMRGGPARGYKIWELLQGLSRPHLDLISWTAPDCRKRGREKEEGEDPSSISTIALSSLHLEI